MWHKGSAYLFYLTHPGGGSVPVSVSAPVAVREGRISCDGDVVFMPEPIRGGGGA